MLNVDKSVAATAAAHGFETLESTNLTEINGSAYVMRHTASNARLLYLKNSDPNKAFSIAFKTPAADDTGVFHILEHSVLCGSDKFPVKEPFVNLLKSSMQTFLNAMTFPDKTVYPVASTNEQDLLNLMDVYLDAVFNPQIYSKEVIFQQEGWHYELNQAEVSSPDSASAQDAPAAQKLQINGVVYNEMKGALSSPDSVLYNALSAALFPDTTYRFESGGTPKAIPDLTYEAFLDNHARHYTPANSYIVLYGDMEIDRFLKFLNEEYLGPLAAKKPSGTINDLSLQSPVINIGKKIEMSTSPDNSCMALGFVVGSAKQRERIMAVNVLLDAIMGSNEAPLKRAILDAGIADDAHAYLSDELAQPFAAFELKGLKTDAPESFAQIIEDQARILSSGGLDRKLIEAALSHAEFVMREHNFGIADGVIYAITSLTGWLYDENAALEFLQYEDTFAALRAKINEGYFEQLIAELLLDNNHKAGVELVPVSKDEESARQEKLDALLKTMTDAQIAQIEADVDALRLAQLTPDSPEALEKLPVLHVSDISDAPFEPLFEYINNSSEVSSSATSTGQQNLSLPLIYHEVSTNGISYAYRYFGLDCVAFEDIPYVSILAALLGKLDTAKYSAADLDTEINSKLGNLNFYTEVHERIAPANFESAANELTNVSATSTLANTSKPLYPAFVISSSALNKNISYAASITDEIITTSNLHDYSKLQDILTQKRVAQEQAFVSSGHSVAMTRLSSYYSKVGVLREQLSGIDNYLFIKDLLENFEARKTALADKLHMLCQCIFREENCVLSFAGGKENLQKYAASLSPLNNSAEVSSPANSSLINTSNNCLSTTLEIPEPVNKHEAFTVPVDITYTSMGANRQSEYSGVWLVASKALSYDYLWNEVRVIGGAYGAGFQTRAAGSSRFYSYRDPRIDETYQRFCASGKWLASFNPTPREFEGYIVSTAANMDAPVKPRDLIRRQDGMFFSGYSPERRQLTRNQILKCSLDDIQKLGSAVTKITDANHICVVGNADIINSSNLGLTVFELIRV